MENLPHLENGSRPNDVLPDRMARPGITHETLAAAFIRHVDGEAAKALIGFAAAGLAIPYHTLCGQPLVVNGSPFSRIRLDKPKGGAKYLSPKDSGAQLYIPKSHRANPTLVLAEGEFKSLSLCEAGFFAVGLGGITSALHEGKLLPRLAEIIEKKAVSTVAFLGDADTPLIYDFAREAVKIRRALPPHVCLTLPRVPFAGHKGIDDSREAMGDEFQPFMEGVIAEAVEVDDRITASSLALKLLLPHLAEIVTDYDTYESRLLKFAKHLDPVALDRLAKRMKDLGTAGITAFKQAVNAADTRASEPSEQRALPNIYFDGDRYFRASRADATFEGIIRLDAFLELRAIGYSGLTPEDGSLSPLEKVVHQIQTTNRVHYAGPLCGRPAGLHREGDIQILATTGPRIIEPAPGDPAPMNAFLAGLLGEGIDPHFRTQFITFCGWLKHFRLALRNYERHTPGQALGLVGNKDCGKSLLQSLITPMSGGRAVDASLCLLGKSDFNRELWGAEHLMLDDDKLGEDGKESHAVRDRLKKLTVAETYNLHGKNRDAVSFRPIWRTTISANIDDESVSILPPPDESFGDKIIYLHCYPPPNPFHDGTIEGRAAFVKSLMEAIPPFLAFVDNLELPEEFRGSRFYVKEFHHPAVLEAIHSNAQESPLGELLDEWLPDAAAPVSGSASSILDQLTRAVGESRVRMFTKSARHFGFQLSRLSKLPQWKGRIERTTVRVGGRIKNEPVNSWRISIKNHSAE